MTDSFLYRTARMPWTLPPLVAVASADRLSSPPRLQHASPPTNRSRSRNRTFRKIPLLPLRKRLGTKIPLTPLTLATKRTTPSWPRRTETNRRKPRSVTLPRAGRLGSTRRAPKSPNTDCISLPCHLKRALPRPCNSFPLAFFCVRGGICVTDGPERLAIAPTKHAPRYAENKSASSM